jgi:hypothetical protein
VKGVPVYLHNVPNIPLGWQVNPAAFSAVPVDPNTGVPLVEGNAPPNYVHGPGFWNLNTSVQRTFALHERLKLNFRVDAFNIFNHPNLGSGIEGFTSADTFGQLIPAFTGVRTVGNANPLYASGSARSLQLSLKLIF